MYFLYNFIKSTFLFSGCLSNIYLNNTHVKLYSNRQLTQSNIFYLAYTKLEIVNSKLENLCYLGNLFFTDTEIDLELSNLLSNFSIDKGTMRIEKIRDEEYFLQIDAHTRFYDKDGNDMNHNRFKLIPTQDLDPIYEENSCIYLFTRYEFSYVAFSKQK